MKSMFHTNGPPAIGSDVFSDAAVEETLKKWSYEGSGAEVEENSIKSKEASSTPLTISEDVLLSANNSTFEDIIIESSSNESSLYAQNTSDVGVDSDSDTAYQKNEASAILEENKTELNSKNEGKIVEEGTKTSTVLEMGEDYTGNETSSTNLPCPPPKRCGRNCFVTINEKGCQDCQCLWIAADCDSDQDCIQKFQFCDLGKCNCQPGYQQDMEKSGVCKLEQGIHFDSFSLSNIYFFPDMIKKVVRPLQDSEESDELDTNDVTKTIDHGKRNKRETKPRRSERLEWPEVEQIPKKVSFDTDELMEEEGATVVVQPVPIITEMPILTTERPKRGLSRFVSEDFAKRFQRTTAKVKKYDWFPPTTTVSTPMTEFTDSSHVPPLTINQFFMIETTVPPPIIIISSPPNPKKIVNDHKMEYMKERKPSTFDFRGDMRNLPEEIHIKKIHLKMPSDLLPPHRKNKKIRTTTTWPDDASEVEDTREVDETEFPISSKIKYKAHAPRALSAEPTREELKDHKHLLELFNAQASSLEQIEETDTTTIKPSFPVLQSFSNIESTPDIQMSLVTERPESKFSPEPDLLTGDSDLDTVKQKPYIIQKSKFTTIAPLTDISDDMASDDPPEVTPEPAPFEQHEMGIWYPMKKGDIPHLGIFQGEFRRAPRKKIRTADDLRLYNEYTKANRQNRPIRIEMDNAAAKFQNECESDKNCGNKTRCCTKKWCDRTNNCGVGKFCLPSCASTKLTFLPFSDHAESVIDIMYD
uniref:Uncharacterized protein n=1 Tax=Caenorhabditis japonica TaxID=281687 RepID=A0A8R1DHR8_CAEJA